MRAFIAIDLPKEIKEKLACLQEKLKASGADVKWVTPQNIHLTLKFLGERDEKKINKITEILKSAACAESAFQIRLSCIGAFPKIDSPRVIWVSVDKGDAETKKIAEKLEEEIAKTGIPKEDRPFSSHITIGRMRSNLNKEKLVQDLNNFAGQPATTIGGLEFTVTKITLFKSTLTPKGPIYEPLSEANLKNT